jgi:hypothetical protein
LQIKQLARLGGIHRRRVIVMLKMLSITLGLVLCSAAAGAEVYRCQDANGVPRYTDRPCDATTQGLRKLPGEGNAAAQGKRDEKTHRLLRAYEDERRIEREQQEAQAAQAAERKRRCIGARDQLQSLEMAGSVYRLDDDGNRIVLSDAERSQRTEQGRLEVQRWCGE